MINRFLFHDPFNPVSLVDLVLRVFWQIALFWCFVGFTVLACVRKKGAWPVLGLFLTAAIPLLIFAVFLFEPSSQERFLPLLPLLPLLVAVLWNLEGRMAAASRYVATGFAVLLPLINGLSFAMASGQVADANRRLQELHAPRNEMLVALSLSDPLCSNPFLVNYLPIVNVANSASARWREHFASEVISRWNRGADIWAPKSLFLERPPETLLYDREMPQQDGFKRIARSAANQTLFAGLAEALAR